MSSKAGGASPFSAGAVIAKRYRLRELLGEGTTGVVWRSEDTTTGDDVALKLVVHPEPESRVHILRGAQACCAVEHHHVARVLDVGETGSGDPFLVMELLSGETLAQKLARCKKLGQREAAAIGRDVARALAAAHDKGVVHRNLKPANIFLHDAKWEIVPVVKVLDFALGDDVVASASTLDDAGAVGSIHMSPEQLLGDEVVDGRSDIWSLGVILYEMCTGAPLFDGRAVEAIRKMWAEDIAPLDRRVRTVDSAFSKLIMACLRRPREERPWPASSVADALETFSGPPERPSMTALAELRASMSPPPPPRLTGEPSLIRIPAPSFDGDTTLVRSATLRVDRPTLRTGTSPPPKTGAPRQGAAPAPERDTLPEGTAPALDGDTLRQAGTPALDRDALIPGAPAPAEDDEPTVARTAPPAQDDDVTTVARAPAPTLDDDATVARAPAPTLDDDATVARAPAPTLDDDATIARTAAAARESAPKVERPSASPARDRPSRGGDGALRPSPSAFHVDDDPTRISTPARFPIARLSQALAAKKAGRDKLQSSPSAPVKQRGRLSPRAALGAAAGALLLSMLGVTAIIVVSARGCGGAHSAPACGARCGERAP